jgi:hypothetical protein
VVLVDEPVAVAVGLGVTLGVVWGAPDGDGEAVEPSLTLAPTEAPEPLHALNESETNADTTKTNERFNFNGLALKRLRGESQRVYI